MPTETSDEPKPIQLVLDELRQLKTDIDTIKRELVYIKREIIKATGMEQTKAGLVPKQGWFY